MPSNRPRFRLSLLVVLTVVVGVLAQTSSAEPEDNAPPEAVSDDISTAKGTPGDVNVLVNDSDPDDDPLTVESWTQGNDGSVTCTGAGACVYMPTDPSFHGADSFTYTVADGHGGTAIGDVFVLVTTTNGQPDAADDELVVVEDSFGAVDVLANDSDPDEDPLTLTTPGPDADHGTVSCTSAGVCTYTPDPDFFGTDTFNYEIDDGQGGADTGDVAITVTPVNDDPNAVERLAHRLRGLAGLPQRAPQRHGRRRRHAPRDDAVSGRGARHRRLPRRAAAARTRRTPTTTGPTRSLLGLGRPRRHATRRP